MDHGLLGFAVVATLLTIAPGVDMVLVTRNTLRGGLHAGLMTSAGILNGLVGWAVLSALGVAAIVAASATAFSILKLAGAAYLVYLGLTSLWGSRRAMREARPQAEARKSNRAYYRQGVLNNLLNPKVGLFYTTFLPQFIDTGDSVLLWTSVLAAVHLAISVVWLAFYAWLVTRIRSALASPRAYRIMDRITGTVLVAFGVRVAREAR